MARMKQETPKQVEPTLEQLKAHGFELYEQIQGLQQRLQAVREMIVKKIEEPKPTNGTQPAA